MLPLFRRFKYFFGLRNHAARSKRFRLAYRAKNILNHDFIEGSFDIVRLNLRMEA